MGGLLGGKVKAGDAVSEEVDFLGVVTTTHCLVMTAVLETVEEDPVLNLLEL